jgi:hypothetical protein
MNKIDAITLGSETAKGGFRNEDDIINKFNNWKTDFDSQKWLKIMGYQLNEIDSVWAVKVSRCKTDVQVKVKVIIKLKHIDDVQNLQVKLVSNIKGFNQIDKRWVDNYVELWDMSPHITKLLKHYTGELPPYKPHTKDKRRMFLYEFNPDDKTKLLNFFNDKKLVIITDILKGRGRMAAEWMLVAQKINKNARWVLKPMNEVMNYFGSGPVVMSPHGSIQIGKITVQRKGGDGGRPTANMLQFKINPAELFEI